MKGLGMTQMLEIIILFVGVICLLPAVNSMITANSSYMDSSQLIAAGLIGIVMILAVLAKFFHHEAPQYYQGYG